MALSKNALYPQVLLLFLLCHLTRIMVLVDRRMLLPRWLLRIRSMLPLPILLLMILLGSLKSDSVWAVSAA